MDKLLKAIQTALGIAQNQPKGREGSLVITKLQEAEHWHRAALGLWDAVPEDPEPEPELESIVDLDESLAVDAAMEGGETPDGEVDATIPEAEPHPLTKPRKRPIER